MSTAMDKMVAARTALVLDQPFFGMLALQLNLTESLRNDTAWTDGVSIGFYPPFIDSLPQAEVLGVMVHEVLHCANGHMWRRDGRDAKKWNYAVDYAINYLIEEAGFKLPDIRLRDERYDGQSGEWIFDRLPDDYQQAARQGGQQGRQQGRGGKGAQAAGEPGSPQGEAANAENSQSPACGGMDVFDAPGDAAEAGVTEASWQQAVQAAAVAAKACGNLPACLERFATEAKKPLVDWKSVLHRFVQQAAKADYTWTMPSTRYVPQGLYMPSMRSEAVGPIAVAVDTSGSIDAVLLAQFVAELKSVADDVQPARVHVIYCDAAVHRVDTFEKDDMVTIDARGGGGTSFAPVMDWCDAQDEPPVALIYLTDMDGSHRKEPPAMPVLWATPSCSAHQQPPYGEVVVLQ